jgi:surface antigen
MPTQQEIDAQRAASSAVNKPSAAKERVMKPMDASAASTAAPTAVSTPSTATVNAQGQASPVGRALTGVPTSYNPYTKGNETVNPTVGVNTQQYSVADKAALATSKGYTIGQDKVTLNDFQRNADGSLGFKLPEKTAGQVAGTPTSSTTPTGPVVGTSVPGATTVGAQTDAQNTAELGAQAADAAQLTAKAIQDTEQVIKDNTELSKGTSYAEAIKSVKETKAAQDQINALQQQNAKMAADENIASAKASYDSLVQTHSYLAGALGQPVSMAGLQGIDSELKRAGEHYSNVKSIAANMAEAQKLGDAESMKGYTEKIAALKKQLNAEVSGSIQQALVNLGKLDQMGDLQSPEAIVKARTDLLDGLKAQYSNLTTATAAKLKLLNDTQEQEYKMQQDKTSVDYNLSNKMGQMVNKYGEPVLVGGKAVSIPKDKQVHSSQMINGNQVTLFTDGTSQTTKAYEVTSAGAIDLDMTQKMGPVTGYVYGKDKQIATGPDGKPLKYSPEAVYDIRQEGTHLIYSNKSNPRDNFTIDTDTGATTAVNGVPVPKRTELRSDNYDVAESAMDVPAGTNGGECTVFARKQLEKNGQDAWINEGLPSAEADTVEWKAGKTNTSVPSVGSLVAMNNGTKYGHWGVVTGIGSDGTITYTSSNEQGDHKVSNNSFKNGDSRVLGYYNPNLPKQGAGSAQSGASESDKATAMDYNSGKVKYANIAPKDRTRIVGLAAQLKEEGIAAKDIGIDMTNMDDTQKDMIANANPTQLTAAKAIAEGNGNALAGFSVRESERAAVDSLAHAINPDYKIGGTTWITNNWVKAGSKINNSNNAISTAILHIGELEQAAKALNNKDMPAYNSAINSVMSAFGIADKGTFELNAEAVGDELAKAYGGESAADRESFKKAFGSDLSPAQFAGKMDKAAQLMLGKLSANAQQFKANVGIKPKYDGFGLTPDSVQFLRDHGAKVDDMMDTGTSKTDQPAQDSAQDSAQGQVYKTDQGEYTMDQIKAEISQQLSSGSATKEQIRAWLKANNIPVK